MEVRWEADIEEIILHLYDLVRSFQRQALADERELYGWWRSLAVKLFNAAFYIDVYFMNTAHSGKNWSSN